MTTPLVGRETDLNLLRGTFEKSAHELSVQLVTLVGEPGVGKSRLVAELFAYIDELPELVTWRQGRCLPYGDGITFWALAEIVKAHAGIYESDAPEEARSESSTSCSPRGRHTLATRAPSAPARDRLRCERFSGGVLHRLAPLSRAYCGERALRLRGGGLALGGRSAARLHRALGRLGAGCLAPRCLHRPTGAVRETRGLGGRARATRLRSASPRSRTTKRPG